MIERFVAWDTRMHERYGENWMVVEMIVTVGLGVAIAWWVFA